MEISTVRDLAGSIRARRRELGWSQATLAEKIGVRRYWVIDVEKGKSTVELGLILRALKALNLKISLEPQIQPESKPIINLGDILDERSGVTE